MLIFRARIRPGFGLLLAVLVATCAALRAAEAAAAAHAPVSPWPAVDSDLAPPPELRQGTLPNGLRYIILPNAQPQNHVSLRLVVAVGSLHENDDERGLAHFVEHMAFRGTRSHPSGSLVPRLQQLGLGLGPDTSAFTFLDHTIYQLELPVADEAVVREGLGVFREFASEVTFDPPLIELERGVIVSEKETRDTPDHRLALDHTGFLWPRARQIARSPAGTTGAIRTLMRPQFVAFYDAWYRPERMAVIVTGDLDPTLAERLITEQLGGLTARAPARPEPTDVTPAAASHSDVAIFSDPGIAGCQLTIEHPSAWPRQKDTHEARVRELQLDLAVAMFQRRLLRLSLDPASTFSSPHVVLRDDIPGWRDISVGSSGKIDDWKKVAADLEQEHRRAFLFGFTADELETERRMMTSQIGEATRTVSTWNSDWLAGRLVDNLLHGRVFLRPATVEADLAGPLAAATLQDCWREFQAAWTVSAPHVYVSANPQFKITREQIAAVLNESRQVKVARFTAAAALTQFPYAEFGAAGTLAKEDQLEDLDVRLTEFSNHVRFNFKTTRRDADTVLVHVRFGEGKLAQPENQPGLDLFANSMFLAGGLGKAPLMALADFMGATTVRPNFAVESDACAFSASCARRDLPLCLQFIAAYLTDPAFRAEALRDVQAGFGSMYASLNASAGGPFALYAQRALAGGDRRFGVAAPPELGARTIDELKAWLQPQLATGAMEVSIVGDIEWPDALAAMSATLGALPERAPRRAFPEADSLHPPHPKLSPQVIAIPPQLKQCAVAWFWPVPPVANIQQDRRLRLLGHILAERLRVRLREQLGATYSPSADFVSWPGFRGLNWITCYAEVDRAHTDKAMQLIDHEAMSLAFKGPDADEFERVKQVYIRSMQDDRQNNSYWCYTVLADVQQRPENIVAARNREADCAAISQADVKALASSLDTSNSFRFITVPYRAPDPGVQAALNRPELQAQTFTAAKDGGGVVPVPVSRPLAIYPFDMLKQKVAGQVIVEFIVDTDGSVKSAKAVKQTNEQFAAAAVAAVKKWKFKPGMRNGKPVPTKLQVPIDFDPKNASGPAADKSAPKAP